VNKLSIYIFAGLLLSLFAPSFGVAQTDLDAIKRATVFIYQAQSLANALVVKCVSTGTIVSADGLIEEVLEAHPEPVAEG